MCHVSKMCCPNEKLQIMIKLTFKDSYDVGIEYFIRTYQSMRVILLSPRYMVLIELRFYRPVNQLESC